MNLYLVPCSDGWSILERIEGFRYKCVLSAERIDDVLKKVSEEYPDVVIRYLDSDYFNQDPPK
jgi:hypothetical protein